VDYKLQTYKTCLKIIKYTKRGLIGKCIFMFNKNGNGNPNIYWW